VGRGQSRPNLRREGRPREMVAPIDIDEPVFQAAVLDAESGEFEERRFVATYVELND
jgi:hypothetical protein